MTRGAELAVVAARCHFGKEVLIAITHEVSVIQTQSWIGKTLNQFVENIGVRNHELGILHELREGGVSGRIQFCDKREDVLLHVLKHLLRCEFFKVGPAEIGVRDVDSVFLVDVVAGLEEKLLLMLFRSGDAVLDLVVNFNFLADLLVVQHLYKNKIRNLLNVDPWVGHLI